MFKPLTNDLYAANLAKYGAADSRSILEPNGLSEAWRNSAIALMSKYDDFLDIGCGPGVFAQYLLSAVPHLRRYTGLEVVHDFVKSAHDIHVNDQRFTFIETSLEDCPLPRKAYECVSALGVMADLRPASHTSLLRFTGLLTQTAYKGVVVSFQRSDLYKGKLATSFTEQDVYDSFHYWGWRPMAAARPENASLVIVEFAP